MKRRFFLGPESGRALYLNSLAWLAGVPRPASRPVTEPKPNASQTKRGKEAGK